MVRAMSLSDNPDVLNAPVRTMRIIIAWLLTGVLFFMGFVLFQRQTGNGPAAPAVPMVTYIALANAFVIMMVSVILPRSLTANLRRAMAARSQKTNPGAAGADARASDTVRLCVIWNTRTIIQ